ncbi:MAG: pyridoxamine kinase, partial [Lachnospiraceae bacterium]|nr:pyridoxamine kinase [Lachnospiraceae bacterium]
MKKIALINDLSGFGKCSLTAAVPVISVLGIQACPLPTAVLSAQTGFPSYYCDDYTDRMNAITDAWKAMQESFDGIYSGYLGSAAQMHNVLYFLEKFHTADTLYLADPVMGDNGQRIRIFTQELLDSMRELTKHAGVITPNLTELCLLADVDYDALTSHASDENYLSYIEDTARRLLPGAYTSQTIVITGIVRKLPGEAYVGNLAVTPKSRFYLETPYRGESFSGTGDLFASVIMGSLINGLTVEEAMKKAVRFLWPAIDEASRDNVPKNHGVYFEKYLN